MFKRVEVDFSISALATVIGARDWFINSIREKDLDKTILILKNINLLQDKFYIPLVNRWAETLPGRVFVQELVSSDPVPSPSVGEYVRRRFPVYDPSNSTVYSGTLILSERSSVSVRILSGSRPDRLPISEELFLLGKLDENAHCLEYPVQGAGAPIKCVLADDGLLSWDMCVFISVGRSESSRKESTTDVIPPYRLYIASETSGSSSHETTSLHLLCIQNEASFCDLYKTALGKINSKGGSYLRGICSQEGTRLESTIGPSLMSTIMTKKQLNVMQTKQLLEERVLSFFKNTEKVGFSKAAETLEENFEHKTILNRLAKQQAKNSKKGSAWFPSQSDINAVIQSVVEEGASIEEMKLSGKRTRRIVGTSFNSHVWPHPSVPLPAQLFDGPLLSEVLPELV